MKILVDADACPVKEIIVRLAQDFNVPVIMFIDTCHIYHDDYSTVITVDKGFNSVDIALINQVKNGDIVVTQDFGLADMCLAKKAYVLNNNGFIYTDDNINRLMFERHIAQKVRRSGGKTSTQRKRNNNDSILFEKHLRDILSSKNI